MMEYYLQGKVWNETCITFISGKGQRKGDSSQFIWLKSLFVIAFISALMYLAYLHQFVERFKNIKWKKLFHDFVEKPCVDFLKVYEVCIIFCLFLSVVKTFLFWQTHEFPWGTYFKILIKMLLINFIELAKLAAFSQAFLNCSFPNDFIEIWVLFLRWTRQCNNTLGGNVVFLLEKAFWNNFSVYFHYLAHWRCLVNVCLAYWIELIVSNLCSVDLIRLQIWLRGKKTNIACFLSAMYFLKTFLFYIEVQPVNNVVIVPGEQQRDSAIHTIRVHSPPDSRPLQAAT